MVLLYTIKENKEMKNKYRSFKEARKFVHSLKLKSNKKWRVYCRSGKRPVDIPTNPNRIYKKEWTTWGDWFGTGTIAKYYIKYRPFREARKFVCSLKLKNQSDWREYTKSGKKPADIPSDPNVVYKNKGWKNLGDWLGTGNLSAKERSKGYRTFKNARKFARKLGLKNREEWFRYCKSGKKPDDIPIDARVYKKEFEGWGDWLGTGIIGRFTKSNTRSFKQARKFVKALKMKGQNDWFEYCKSGKKPSDIPSNPQFNYKKEWEGWGDFLGTGNISNVDKMYIPFKEARRFAIKLGFKSGNEWIKFAKENKKLLDEKRIPASPRNVYEKEWQSMGDWLGTGNISNADKKFKPFKDARKFVRSLKIKSQSGWSKYKKSGKKPTDIPATPTLVYKKEWVSWADWLDTGNVATQQREILLHEEAEKQAHILVKKLGIETHADWLKAYHEGKIPKNLPSQPWNYYTESFTKKRRKK